MKALRLIALLPLLLVSCASDKKAAATPQSSGGRERSLDEWVQETSRDNGFKQDANGNLVPKSDKRSSFESQGESSYAKKDYKKPDYKTGDYATKSWWGNKDYGSKQYAGNTDGSRFQTTSRLQGKGAREAGTNARIPDNYKTGAYSTGAAQEAGATPIKKGSSDEIENTRATFQQPEITDWREQRKLTMDQSKGILGN
ncbi:MAG: hypothetical protein V4819_26365 [Verrucomicrobiota bacterium]